MPMPFQCDFCQNNTPVWSHPCPSFVIPEIESESIGPWLACDPCHHLIVSGAVDELAEIAMAQPGAVQLSASIGRDRALYVIRDLIHGRFFSYRRGEPRRIDN